MEQSDETNYSAEAGEFLNLSNKSQKINEMSFMETLSVLKKILFKRSERVPLTKLPEVKPDLAEFLRPSDFLKFIWLGHSSIMLNLEGKTLLIDPVLGKSASPFDFLITRFQAPVLNHNELPIIDAVVISHDHYDHLDKSTIKSFRNSSTRFIVPLGVGKHLRDWGIEASRITELNWGETTILGTISLTATPAQHFSGRGLFDRNKTLWASWVIAGQEEKIFFSGDSGYGDHFKEIGKRYGPFDLAFIENGQYDVRWPEVHMQPEETLQAQIDLNAKYLVPIHWGMFDLSLHHWAEPIERTYKIAKAWDIPIYTPRLGEIVNIGLPFHNKTWWKLTPETQGISDLILVPELTK